MRTEETAPESVPAPLNPAAPRRVEAELLAPDHALAGQEQALAALSQARVALATLDTLPEALEIVSQARALGYYLRQRRESLELINEASEMNLWASRRGGDILRVMKKNKGAATPSHDESASPPTLKEMGIDHNQSSRLQRLAAIPEEVFQAYLRETKAKRGTISALGLVGYARKLERQPQSAPENAPQPDDSASPCLAAPPPQGCTGLAEEIVTLVTDCLQKALADHPASAVREGFEQAVTELRRRIDSLSDPVPRAKEDAA